MAWGARNLISTQDFERATIVTRRTSSGTTRAAETCVEINGAFVQESSRRLHAIDATRDARWRGGGRSTDRQRGHVIADLT